MPILTDVTMRLVRLWLDNWRDRPVVVRSPLSVAEAVKRLDAGLTRSVWGRPPTPSVIRLRGQVSPEYVRLTAYYAGRQGALRPVLDGHIVSSPNGGSELIGTIGLHPATRVFTAFWLGAVALMAAGFAITSLWQLVTGQWSSELLGPSAVPFVLLCFGVAITTEGLWSSARTERYLRGWLRKRLNADTTAEGGAAV